MSAAAESWAPPVRTLPTTERPLRVAEFDELFTHGACAQCSVRARPHCASISSGAQVAAQAADLAVRETGCCSFFTFSLITTGGSLWLETSVPDSQDARAVLRRPVGEWIEFLADCGRSDAEIDKELRNQRLTLAELDE